MRIAVIGAGPAGSSFVRYCLAEGISPRDLVLIDRAKFPRPKLCGGALTWRGTRALKELCGHLPGGAETRGLEFRSALGSFPIAEVGAQWLYDRAYLDASLAASCVDAGVKFRQECAVTSIERDRSWTITYSKGPKERFDWVVGADGACGVVARAAQLPRGITGRLVEGIYRGDSRLDPTTLYFDFDPIIDSIPGYAWIFPYPKPNSSEPLWKIGIMDGRGTVDGRTLRRWTNTFAKRHGFELYEPKLRGWPEHYYSPKTKAHLPGLLLTGEAWGVDPLLGEGIAPALEMSMYAAGRLKVALDRGSDRIAGYERRFRRTAAGRNLHYQYRLANLLYGGQSHRFLRILFQHRAMQELAQSGTAAYGRLAQYGTRLATSFAWQVLKSGMPSNRPVPKAA